MIDGNPEAGDIAVCINDAGVPGWLRADNPIIRKGAEYTVWEARDGGVVLFGFPLWSPDLAAKGCFWFRADRFQFSDGSGAAH